MRNPRAPFCTGTGGDAIYASPDGDIIVTMSVKKVAPPAVFDRDLVAVDRDGKKLWARSGYRGFSLCYSPVKNTILTCETDPPRIEELDARTGETLNVLKETKLGPITDMGRSGAQRGSGDYGGGRAVYDVDDQERFWVSDSEHHVVFLTDFKGEIHHLIGEYGVAGSDESHLNHPQTVSTTPSWGRLLIGDWGNNRVIEFGRGLKLSNMLPFPQPRACYLWANQVAIYNGGWPSSKYGVFIFSDHLGMHPIVHLPYLTDALVPHPQEPGRLLIRWDDGFVREVLIDEETTKAVPPATALLFSNHKVTSDDGFTAISPPIVDLFRPNKTVCLLSNKDGVAEVEVARFTKLKGGYWSGEWDIFETVELKAGKLTSWVSTHPLAICRIKIKLKEEGIINGWTHLTR